MAFEMSPWPCYSEDEVNAVTEVLRSNRVNYWTGEQGKLFEKEFAELVGSNHAIALMNGTVALELALHALGIGKGDEVIVTPSSFIASVSCVVNSGAIPVFVDLSRNSQNITPESIAAAITPETKAILCVHLTGWPCDMDEIMQIASDHDLYVIEDCAQAHGATYRGKSVGTFGNVGCWSFCQDKIITTGGEGGMVTTNNTKLWSRMWSFKDHGKSWHAVHEQSHPPGFRWLHESFGTNWRMTEMQAAIGRIQLTRLASWTEKRQANSSRLESACLQTELFRVPTIPDYIGHARYRCNVFIRTKSLRKDWSRDRVVDEIHRCGVPCFQGICPEIYLEKAFDGLRFRPVSRLPVARELGETSLSFLVHPTLNEADIEKSSEAIKEVGSNATGL